MEIKKYIHKPTEIEAIKIDEAPLQIEEIRNFVGNDRVRLGFDAETFDAGVWISTNEGLSRVNEGSYIIKGTTGEFYPCDGEIFDKIYEVVKDGNV